MSAQKRRAVVVTGEYGQRILDPILERLARLAGRKIRLLTIPNDFFGGNTAVAGLMVGGSFCGELARKG